VSKGAEDDFLLTSSSRSFHITSRHLTLPHLNLAKSWQNLSAKEGYVLFGERNANSPFYQARWCNRLLASFLPWG